MHRRPVNSKETGESTTRSQSEASFKRTTKRRTIRAYAFDKDGRRRRKKASGGIGSLTKQPMPYLLVVGVCAFFYLARELVGGASEKGSFSDDLVRGSASVNDDRIKSEDLSEDALLRVPSTNREEEAAGNSSSEDGEMEARNVVEDEELFTSPDNSSPDEVDSDDEDDTSDDEDSASSDSADEDRNGVQDYMEDYYKLRQEFDEIFPEPDAEQRRRSLVKKLRKIDYRPIGDFDNGIRDCPFEPPRGYPMQWPILDLIKNWNPDDTTPHTDIYQGICVFDYTTEYDKAMNYRNAGVPFVIRDDPEVLRTVERWNHPEYMHRMMGTRARGVDYSKNHHFMYFHDDLRKPEGWEEPTVEVDMTYAEWHEKAMGGSAGELGPDKEHWYYYVRGCGPEEECSLADQCEFLFDEMPYFQPKESFYKLDPQAKEGIDCRFGMTGVIAECHFDAGENMIAVLGGERRYILAAPEQCSNLALFPNKHPSRRHSQVDWGKPDLEAFPEFRDAVGNEIILQAGDVLYVPSHWFHFIVNLSLNWQCNSRSNQSQRYSHFIRQCGFDP